jgi:hypothetical protein
MNAGQAPSVFSEAAISERIPRTSGAGNRERCPIAATIHWEQCRASVSGADFCSENPFWKSEERPKARPRHTAEEGDERASSDHGNASFAMSLSREWKLACSPNWRRPDLYVLNPGPIRLART